MNEEKNEIRFLAAIMFTDMVGYSALMASDEEKTIKLRKRNREVLEKYVTEHKGRILQYYGDGTLSIFGSAIEAAKCAIEIQNELKKEPQILLRIGIHSGDIVWDDEGVYGSGVNIAAKIQSVAIAGGVFISEKIFDEIKNHHEFSILFVGEFEFKNLNEKIEIYALTNEGLTIPDSNYRKSMNLQTSHSIAVLPFLNLSSDIENEYFSDGITEEIINELVKIEGLRITSRTSTFAFKGKGRDVREIGKKLNVDHILEGSVRKFGDKIRITAQLINTKDGFHEWSQAFDRKLEDIFEIQDEIAKNIANKLREKLIDESKSKTFVKCYTRNIEAHNLYLKGLFYQNKYTPEDIDKAISFYKESIEKEPGFALPYSALANCYVFLGSTGQYLPDESYKKAKEYASKALQLDNNFLDSNISMAFVKLFYDWDFNEAFQYLQKAYFLNSEVSSVHHALGIYYSIIGNYQKAIDELKTALQMDPLSLTIRISLADVYTYIEDYNTALSYLDNVIEYNPNFRTALWNKGTIYLLTEKYPEALELFLNTKEKIKDSFRGITPIGLAYALMGNYEKVNEILEQLQKREREEKSISLIMDFAVINLGLKNFDKVFVYLNKAYEKRIGSILTIFHHPLWKPIRTDARYYDLMQKIGLNLKDIKNYVLN